MNRNPEADRNSSLPFRPEIEGGFVNDSEAPWILVIEDNPGDVDLIREALKDHGVEAPVLALHDGAQACDLFDEMDAFRGGCPSLVILDLNLPKMTGLEVLERIRRSPRCGSLPVVVLTSSSAERDRAESIRLGADRFLSKPSSLDDFLALGQVFGGMLKR